MQSSTFPLIDGHIDTFYSLQKRQFHERSSQGHCDLVRMREGGIMSAIFAIYPAQTRRNLIHGLDNWIKIVYNPINALYHIKTINDFEIAQSQNKIGAILHFEGAGGIDKNHELLRITHHIGLRTLGLCHANKNKFASGVLFEERQYTTGLSALGAELVQEAQSLGITIDVSHLNDNSFWDLMRITHKPVIASHSNSRSVVNHMRNLTDDQITALQGVHGTIGINFGILFLSGKNIRDITYEITLDAFKAHIDHIVDITDINTVAIGSDFDGTSIPDCMKDVTYLPKLWKFLLENGYSKMDVEKISHKNLLRVFKDTWKP